MSKIIGDNIFTGDFMQSPDSVIAGIVACRHLALF
jgi:hypothetical protein